MTGIDSDFEELPVIGFKQDILDASENNQIIICIGETGSGKTTQIPQFFLDNDKLGGALMAVTQPRKIAAITVAQRVSDERKSTLGHEIGYSVRFDDKTSNKTKVKYMTDGILIRECLSDKSLSKYRVIMLDEAHERSLHTDILFGLLKMACKLRPELRLIITSATLDSEKFGSYFNGCPILRVPGRVFPVDIYHSKTKQVMTITGPANNSYVQAAVDVVMRIHKKDEEGHILVFLTGQEEIERACELIRTAVANERFSDRELVILPLYAALPSEIQARVFKKPADLVRCEVALKTDGSSKLIRKCVVATNIAETSITVPQVRFVVDTGFVKQKAYNANRGMESLVVVPVSKVSALQRAGRAGRTGPGQCYRLYSSECFDSFMDETVPEILRTNLSNTVLYLKALSIRDIIGFDFLDAPSEDQIIQALQLLHTLGALDDEGTITPLGTQMSGFPLEPNLSRVLIEAAKSECDCLEEMTVIASMLCVENIYYSPPRKQQGRFGGGRNNPPAGPSKIVMKVGSQGSSAVRSEPRVREEEFKSPEEIQAETAHNLLKHPYGDHFTYLNIFNRWKEDDYSQQWCEQNYINYKNMKTARKIRQHLETCIQQANLSHDTRHHKHSHSHSVEKRICAALVSGYYMNSAVKCANDNVFKFLPLDKQHADRDGVHMLHLHPSSALVGMRPPEYLVFQDLVHSSKVFMKHTVRVDRKVLEAFQSRWVHVTASQLSGRVSLEDTPTARTVDSVTMIKGSGGGDQGDVGVKRSLSEASFADSVSSAGSVDAVSLAKMRFLARKVNK